VIVLFISAEKKLKANVTDLTFGPRDERGTKNQATNENES